MISLFLVKQTAALEFCRLLPFHLLNLSARTGVSWGPWRHQQLSRCVRRKCPAMTSAAFRLTYPLRKPTRITTCIQHEGLQILQTPESHLKIAYWRLINSFKQHHTHLFQQVLQGDHDALEVHLLQVIYQGTGVLLVKPCCEFCAKGNFKCYTISDLIVFQRWNLWIFEEGKKWCQGSSKFGLDENTSKDHLSLNEFGEIHQQYL